MKKSNFYHRVLGWVEQELEATLAVLIVLAAVVGYSLAATEAPSTPSQGVTAQQAASFTIGSQQYQTLSFDSQYTTSAYRVRTLGIASGDPSDISSIPGKGMSGATPGGTYRVSVSLSQAFAGSIYVGGTYSAGSVTLNDKPITNASTPVAIDSTTKLTLTFPGGPDTYIRTLSVASLITPPATVANIFLIPNSATMEVGSTRTFVAFVTDTNGKTANVPIAWSITSAKPSDIATVNSSTGEVTATGAGTITVKASTNGGKTATATVTIIAKSVPVQSTVTPTNTGTATGTATTTPPSQTSTSTSQGLLDQLASLLVKPSKAATSTTQNTTPTASASEIANTLFSPTMVTARVAATGSTAPSQTELNQITTGMTLTQKIATQISVGVRQVVTDIKAMVVGQALVTDANGKVLVKRPNALGLFADAIRGLLSGAGATPTKINPEELPGGNQ